jgi:hypothetical protein
MSDKKEDNIIYKLGFEDGYKGQFTHQPFEDDPHYEDGWKDGRYEWSQKWRDK